MSRYYRILVKAKNTNLDELNQIMECDFGWDNIQDSWEETYDTAIFCYEGEGSLCGGMSEEECYEQIKSKYEDVNPQVKLEVTLTYLEDLPQNTYGSLDD